MAKRVECDQCSNFISPTMKDGDNRLFGNKTNAKCKLGKRVMFRKPKVWLAECGYFRYCNDFNKIEL